ncbi:MAG TPA: hypothetical protein VNY05_29335 [Candidatus Acidoferrales bacterium]|nr:hypothetical protein [Candidatus Acidoferrales bacterium]
MLHPSAWLEMVQTQLCGREGAGARIVASFRTREIQPDFGKSKPDESEMALFSDCIPQLVRKNLTTPTVSGTLVYDNHLRLHE